MYIQRVPMYQKSQKWQNKKTKNERKRGGGDAQSESREEEEEGGARGGHKYLRWQNVNVRDQKKRRDKKTPMRERERAHLTTCSEKYPPPILPEKFQMLTSATGTFISTTP